MNSTDFILAASESVNPLLPNPWEILVTGVGFAVLLFIVIKVIAPKFEQSYEDRVTAIEGGLEKAEAAQKEAEETLAQYKAQLLEARTEANRIREEARSEGAQILADLKTKATDEATRITEQSHRQIEAERVAALTSLRTDVGVLATELASKVVDEALKDDARAQRVVDQFLTDLEAQQNAGASN